MKWINALGLILQFISFWFAAPELLGANTLKRFENGLRKFVSSLPIIMLLLVVLGFAVSLSVSGIIKGLKAKDVGLGKGELTEYFIVLAICFVVYLVFLFFFKKIKNWLDVHLAQPLVTNLINDNKARSMALVVGAVLFTLGFLMQLTAVIV